MKLQNKSYSIKHFLWNEKQGVLKIRLGYFLEEVKGQQLNFIS